LRGRGTGCSEVVRTWKNEEARKDVGLRWEEYGGLEEDVRIEGEGRMGELGKQDGRD